MVWAQQGGRKIGFRVWGLGFRTHSLWAQPGVGSAGREEERVDRPLVFAGQGSCVQATVVELMPLVRGYAHEVIVKMDQEQVRGPPRPPSPAPILPVALAPRASIGA
jgi:hypothetical protein